MIEECLHILSNFHHSCISDEMGQLGIQLRDEQHFSQRYQICTDEILGSGQFGTVYGGLF